MSPAITADAVCAVPLNGTWTMSTPVCSLRNSIAKCGVEPVPTEP
jgi:hypothetical protein